MELELQKKINEAYNKIKELKQKLYDGSENYDHIFDKIEDLYQVIDSTEAQLKYLKRKIEITDGEIELTYLSDNKPGYKKYDIYLCGNSEKIGYIEYRDFDSLYLGNIGYGIEKKYNGHNYASKAVILLNEVLRKEGIESVIITAEKSNIASIKTIEKVGGVPIQDDDNIVIYKCNISLRKQK